MKTTLFLLICGIGLVGCENNTNVSPAANPSVSGTSTNDLTANPTVKPDNTAVNSRDRASDAATAGMQGQGNTDVQITAGIRRRIMDGKMSITAQNVKIVCQNGKVKLRGPVNSQDEKDAIGRMANDVAGADNVDNELEIKPNG